MRDYIFGNFLYTLRSEAGLSQTQLGELLGVTNKAVSKWETGSTKPHTNLIPKIAEIFGITVEELFTCKRIEANAEYERIKHHLTTQKKRFAILSSVFLSLFCVTPLLLIEFIRVVMVFHLPDDVIGPLGAMSFLFLFVIAFTAFVIYRRNHKKTLTPSDFSCSPHFASIIKKGLGFSSVAWLCLFILLFPIYRLLLSCSSSALCANIFLAVSCFILTLLLGVIIAFANIKRLLKMRFPAKHIPFRKWPVWAKLGYIVYIILYPVVRIFTPNQPLLSVIVANVWIIGWVGILLFAITKRGG